MVVARDCEMTTSRADFMRLLPAAVGGLAYRLDDGDIVQGDAVRGWRIALAPLPELAIGLIRLERFRVVFSFRGHSASEISAFLHRFDLYFARGGG